MLFDTYYYAVFALSRKFYFKHSDQLGLVHTTKFRLLVISENSVSLLMVFGRDHTPVVQPMVKRSERGLRTLQNDVAECLDAVRLDRMDFIAAR